MSTDDSSRRDAWIRWACRISGPLLSDAAAGRVLAGWPGGAGTRTPESDRVQALAAVGRCACGLAPWLEHDSADSVTEHVDQQRTLTLVCAALERVLAPAGPDAPGEQTSTQLLVEAAHLAEAVIRAPRRLIARLDPTTCRRLIELLLHSRHITPHRNNWLLFSAMVEVGLRALGEPFDKTRIEFALYQHEQWYIGDGWYGDGPEMHFDYYNSLVIHPMLLTITRALADVPAPWQNMRARVVKRAVRYATSLERCISPEGTLPVIGRSLGYRCGVLQALAQVALDSLLPSSLAPGQVRSAMHAVIERLLGAPGTFDERGRLNSGFAGDQRCIVEPYLGRGSAYLCMAAFLPLGLGASHPFWTDPPQDWTARRAYAGELVPQDKAYAEQDAYA